MSEKLLKSDMKIRLLADDSKFPNIAIMKISAYHKLKGDDVGWYDPLFDNQDTDVLYHSRIFNFTKPYLYYPANAKIIKGGTGFDIYSKLPEEIEKITDIDWSLYPDCDFSVLFTSRGCIRNCEFCVVRKKEGLIHDVPFTSLNPNGKCIKLLDNNFFANKNWESNLEKLRTFNKPLDFTQGIDLRILTEKQCEELKKCKIKNISCAWDNYNDKDIILPKLEMLTKYINPAKITCYVLIGFKNKELQQEDIERVETLRTLKVNPYVMVYIDYSNPNYKKSQSCKDYQRYVDKKWIFKADKWENYKKKGKEEDAIFI